MKKKISEMTFKEFSAPPERKEVRKEILRSLTEEGFTEKQLDEMNVERVLKLYLDACMHSVATRFDKEIASICNLLEKMPQAAPIVKPILKRMAEELEEDIKELEEKLEEEEKE